MRKYKITKVYLIEAESKQHALWTSDANPTEDLDFISVREQPQEKGVGWIEAAAKQVTGR